MERCPRKGESCLKLLDLIPEEREWSHKGDQTEEKKLELRLGPPGDENWLAKSSERRGVDQSLLSLGHFSSMKSAEKKPFAPPSASKTPLSNSSQKRSAPGPVVGWPPVRSFRKNLASTSSSKLGAESQSLASNKKDAGEKEAAVEPNKKGLFVKINMDGVPIGRKVDLKSYDSYEQLSAAVDDLFRGLLAAQRDSSAIGGLMSKQEEEKPITGLLDGNGEYTLVYEDNEGDRMLVGDVPWHMFLSTVKRLRVLKSSELPGMNLGSSKQGKTAA